MIDDKGAVIHLGLIKTNQQIEGKQKRSRFLLHHRLSPHLFSRLSFLQAYRSTEPIT